MRFLIVDDDQTSRRIIQLFLRSYGESLSVGDGQEAIDAYKKSVEEGNPFDVVYLDMVMPGVSGLDVVAAIRQHETERKIDKGVPVLMLTGETDVSHINMAKSFGVVEYLLKPIQEERVVQGLERLDLIKNDDTW